MYKKKGSKKKEKFLPEYEDEEPMSLRISARNPACVITEEDLHEIRDLNLGEGFYSTVKLGVWKRPNGKKNVVAIKCIKEEVVKDHLDEILTEANNMVKLEHKSIIKLFGICLVSRIYSPCKVKLVTEYAKYGSLIKVITDKDPDYRSFFCQLTRLWQYALQIAEGMEYLHSKDLIHFDLAARNVLVVWPNLVRITDFGLARLFLQGQRIILDKQMPIAWCAPELIKGQLITKKCDVWSYGVLLWEMQSFGKKPWGHIPPEKIMEHVCLPEARLPQPEACCSALYTLMTTCWAQEAKDRLQFTDIISTLKGVEPVTASAVNSVWSTRKGKLSFQKGTKITIIDRSEDKYLAQNERAEVGHVNVKYIDFNVVPSERQFDTLKPKISGPFDIRPTPMSDSIKKEYETTGVSPANPLKFLNQTEESTQTQNNQDQETSYVPMEGQDVPEKQEERTDPATQDIGYTTLPKKKRAPVPTPRKHRTRSVSGQSSTPNGKESTTSFYSPDESRSYLDNEDGVPLVFDWKEIEESLMYKTEQRQTADNPNEQKIDKSQFDSGATVELPPTEMQDSTVPSCSLKMGHFPSTGALLIPPLQTSTENEPESRNLQDINQSLLPDVPQNQIKVEESILVELDIGERTADQSAESNPPPLPEKGIPPRNIGDLQPLRQALFPHSPDHPRPLSYPSYCPDDPLSQPRTTYYAQFPQPLPVLQEIENSMLNQAQQDESREREASVSSSGRQETAYGAEINEEIKQIQSKFPEMSNNDCYAKLLKYKDVEKVIKVLEVCNLTSIEENDATFHLGHCRWDVERAVNYILDYCF